MPKSARILFLADVNSIHTERWARAVVSAGHELAVYSLNDLKVEWPKELNVKVRCFGSSLETTRSTGRFAKGSYLKARHDAKDFVKEFNPDILHAHYASSYGTLARFIKHPTTVVSLWGSDVYEFPKRSFLHKFLFKRAILFPKVVCSTSQDMAREAKLYVDREIVHTPFGVDTEKFKAEKKTGEGLVIGTVKSLEDVYGIDRLISVFASYCKKCDDQVSLQIYGSGSNEEELKAQVNELEINDRVEFKGRVSGSSLIDAFEAIDVFVALSRRESFGVAVLEAQAAGCIALTSDVGGLPEVVDPNSGIIVDGENELLACGKLKELVETRSEEKSASARKFVVENYSEKKCVERMLRIYDELV